MIEWRDQGVVLSMRRHGESAAIIELFCAEHGRVAGVVRGGGGRRMAPVLQPGTQLEVTWRARLEEHLGHFTAEPLRSRAAQVLGDRMALAGLNALCALLRLTLPERAAAPGFYGQTIPLFDLLGQGDLWPLAYLRWEMQLLEELGFGLDLRCCAVTGQAEDLAYVSPKTGRAVSRAGAGDWADRLLDLPPVMLGGAVTAPGLRAGLEVTGYFLEHRVLPSLDAAMPEARARLIALL